MIVLCVQQLKAQIWVEVKRWSFKFLLGMTFKILRNLIALLDIKPCVLTCKYGRLYELNEFVYLDEKFNIHFQLSTDGMNVKGYNCYNDNNINHKNISLHGHTGAILTGFTFSLFR